MGGPVGSAGAATTWCSERRRRAGLASPGMRLIRADRGLLCLLRTALWAWRLAQAPWSRRHGPVVEHAIVGVGKAAMMLLVAVGARPSGPHRGALRTS